MERLLQLISDQIKYKDCFDALEQRLSIFAVPMSQTPQEPLYHGEGDVWSHTKMVCQAFVQLEAFAQLDEQRQQAVFLAALLHDIGKIRTTRLEQGRWTSPNHTVVGAKMARQFLWQELGMCGTPEKQQLRETVCNLIRYHSVPPHVIDDPNGKRRLMAITANQGLCPMFTVALLCLLCQADALGRVCVDQQHMLEQIQLCAELARESGCYAGAFPFPNEHTAYAYLSGREIPPEVVLYDDSWGPVILVCGLPGTGKDTWIRENCSQLPMISLDEIRQELHIAPTDNQNPVAELARERAKDLLRKRQRFVWNATNLSHMVRGKQLELFARYGAATRIVWLETGWQEQLRRNGNRQEQVPEAAICHMMEQMVLPEAKEAHFVTWQCV